MSRKVRSTTKRCTGYPKILWARVFSVCFLNQGMPIYKVINLILIYIGIGFHLHLQRVLTLFDMTRDASRITESPSPHSLLTMMADG
jgi:hypothetical protein